MIKLIDVSLSKLYKCKNSSHFCSFDKKSFFMISLNFNNSSWYERIFLIFSSSKFRVFYHTRKNLLPIFHCKSFCKATLLSLWKIDIKIRRFQIFETIRPIFVPCYKFVSINLNLHLKKIIFLQQTPWA